MSFARVTYPPPPPTSNTLTLHERNQFVRSSKKIGKVLGSTPHLIDGSYSMSPLHISLSTLPSADKPHLERIDSPVSDCSSKRPRSSSSYSSMSSESTDTHTSLSSSPTTPSYTETINSADSWRVRKPTRKPPPLLRLASGTMAQGPPSAIASVKPTLETIPASPPFEAMSGDNLSGSRRHSPKTISFAAFSPPRAPSFNIPSEATLRWAKMDRLKRKLGDGVPVQLVFPNDDIDLRTFDPISTNTQSVASGGRPAISDTDASKVHGHTPPKSSFSLTPPLFAIVEGPDDHVTGCFEFGSRKDRVGRGRRA